MPQQTKNPAVSDRASEATTPRTHDTAALRRRAGAALRVPALECGHSDPWCCACSRPALRAEAVKATVAHLEHYGLTPLFTDDDLRRLWRDGYRDLAAAVRRVVA